MQITGLRGIECVRLRVKNVDFERNEIIRRGVGPPEVTDFMSKPSDSGPSKSFKTTIRGIKWVV